MAIAVMIGIRMASTFQNLVDVCAAPVLDHAPNWPLCEVQQVVVHPESH